MSVVRQQALEALAAVLVPVVPEIEHVLVETADADQEACFPSLVLETHGAFTFQPFDEDEVEASTTTRTVHVGDFSGQVRLQLGAKSKAERRRLGDRLLDVFLNTPGKPGVLVVQLSDFEVGGIPFEGPIPVAFRLGDSSWDDELVFDRKRYQNLVLDVELPALVTQTNVYDINRLVFAFTEDLTSAAATATLDPLVEVLSTGVVDPYP